ncbi:MAG: lipoyl synthase [Acidimicrobiales bacterium]
MSAAGAPLRVRWLGRVGYSDALAMQRGLWATGQDDWLLLLEHPHTYTMGVRASLDHVLVDPAELGADLVRTDRGGDVTYHGPGQVVGYPVLSVPTRVGSTPAYVHGLESLVIDALADLGLPGCGRVEGLPGVWVDPEGGTPRKICAIGVRLSRGRSMHGFALNVAPDLSWFGAIVPCGLEGRPVTSLAAEGVSCSMPDVVEAVAARAGWVWAGQRGVDRQDVGGPARPGEVGSISAGGGLSIGARKPAWLRAPARFEGEYGSLRRTLRSLELVTVCEEAGCPNIYECWGEGTATFMINGSQCSRACGFCQVHSARPSLQDPEEPSRVAEAVAALGLEHAVVTTVARDDLPDQGAGAMAATVEAIRRRAPGAAVEVLISDCKGKPEALDAIFATRPEILNHNLETVLRLQRAVRPSASYARSLGVLARAKEAGLVTKSGLMVGLGESFDEVVGALADLRGVGVDIVTVGQYLRPSAAHLPVSRWWEPAEFAALRASGEGLGIPHVEASPLTRSSYHAKSAAVAAGATASASASVAAVAGAG